MASPETKIRITGDPKGALTAIDKVKGGLTGLSATAARLPGFTALGAAVAGIFSVSAIDGIADTADAMAKMGRRVGLTTEELGEYKYALNLSGVSVEEFAIAMDKLNTSMIDAANGVAAPAEAFSKFGVAVQNEDKTLRKGREVLDDLMQGFINAGEGAERLDGVREILGKSGTKLASFLSLGKDGMEAMRKEFQLFGEVITDDLAEASERFNDNMSRLSGSMNQLKVSLGNSVIPALARLSDELVDAQRAGLGFFETLEVRASVSAGKLGKDMEDITAESEKLKKKLAELEPLRAGALSSDNPLVKSGLLRDIEEEVASTQRQIAYYELRKKALAEADAADDASAKKRTQLFERLSAAHDRLADAETAARKKATTEQIKDAEKLRDALQKAWQGSVDGARKAGEEATALLKQAAEARADYQSKANARRSQDMSPEDQQAEAVSTASKATDDASFYAAAAQVAAIDGRAKAAAEYAERAKKLIEEASAATESIQDNETAAKNFERIGEAAEALKKAEAGLKQGEANQLTEQAQAQQQQIASVAAQLAELQKSVAGVEINLGVEKAKREVAEIEAAIKRLAQEAEKVKINVGSGNLSAAPFQGNGASGGFASGGFTGYGGKYAPAGIVHRGEYVFPQEAVKRLGINYLADLHKRGLRGYASGGLVSNLRVPNISAPTQAAGKTPVVLDFGALGRYSAAAAGAEVEGIERALRRAKLKGGRR
ncbi:hypothetical protein [Denitromonas halophila]|uniref:Phage tail tape measure protein n=1 Tax=Denitromonas halophila TaxID=1629404 RepID=A0A557QLR9_9RHOO|nr:hypothetical protein [Denitromonas halophila]TVO53858.1 hypothetical protein FHP91_13760 [Denitromonas halophila]